MAWADTANNLRQQIGQKTSNIANIGQSERESRRARNVALLNTLANAGLQVGGMAFQKKQAELGREHDVTMEALSAGNKAALQQLSETEAGARQADEILARFRQTEMEQGFKAAQAQLDRELERYKAQLSAETQITVSKNYSAQSGDKDIGPMGDILTRAWGAFTQLPAGSKLMDPQTGQFMPDQFTAEVGAANLQAWRKYAESWKPVGVDQGAWDDAVRSIFGKIGSGVTESPPSEPSVRGGTFFDIPQGERWRNPPVGGGSIRTPGFGQRVDEQASLVKQVESLVKALEPLAAKNPEVKAELAKIPGHFRLQYANVKDLQETLDRLNKLVGRPPTEQPAARMELGVPLSNPNQAPEPMRTMPKIYFPGM